MTTKRKWLLPILVVFLFALACVMQVSAETISHETLNNLSGAYFVGTTDKDPASYKVGETMTFTVKLMYGSDTVSVPKFTYSIRGEDGNSISETVYGGKGEFTVSTKIKCPGFVRLTVYAADENGNEINSNVRFNGGAAAEIEKLVTQMAEPDDFDAYWEKCLTELDTVAPDIYNIKKAAESDANYDVYDLYINCVGSKNFLNTAASGEEPNGATYAAGKLVVPKNLDPASAKLYLGYQGAGVYTSPGVLKKAGYVTLCVYAHSIEMSRETSYYDNLRSGLLGSYMARQLYNDNADESYTKYMILRDLQSVRFLKKFFGASGGGAGIVNGIDTSAWTGLWNNKDIELYGQSQGGFQCIAVAALDHDISFCNPWVPCWCDMYAKTYFPTRFTMGLVYEHYSQKYFESVSLGKRIVCKTRVDTGFGDDTCPTPGVICMYNALTCEKELRIFQGMMHNCSTSYASGVNKPYSQRSADFSVNYGGTFTFDWEIANVSGSSLTLVDSYTVKADGNLGISTVTFVDSNRLPIDVNVVPSKLNYAVVVGGNDDIANGISEGIYLRHHEQTDSVIISDLTGTVSALDAHRTSHSDEISAGKYTEGDVYLFIVDDGSVSSLGREGLAAAYKALKDDFGAKYVGFIANPSDSGVSYAAQVAYAMQLDGDKYPDFYVVENSGSGDYNAVGRQAALNLFSITDGNMPYSSSSTKLIDAFSGEEIRELHIIPAGNEIALAVVPSPLYAIRDGIFTDISGLDAVDAFTYRSTSSGGTVKVGGNVYKIYPSAKAYGTEETYSWVLDDSGVLNVISDGAIAGVNYPWSTYASEIKEINIANGAKSIGAGAFADMTALETIRLPYTLTAVDSEAFSGFAGVTLYGYESNDPTVDFAEKSGVTFVSLGACGDAGEGLIWTFSGDTLTISGSGTTVSSGCYAYNTGKESSWYKYYIDIKKVVLPESVRTISKYCFTQMNSLTTLEITSNLKTIEGGAFQNTRNLKTIYISGNTPVTGTLDLSCVTSLPGGYQFDGGTSATTIILSDDLSGTLGDKFVSYNNTLRELVLPAGVVSIGSRTFCDCSALKTLKVLGGTSFATPSYGSTTFETIYGYVGTPAETLANTLGVTFRDLTGDQYDGEVEYRGDCGDSVYFKIISNGDDTYSMYFYGAGETIVKESPAQWSAYADKITYVVFRGDINRIGVGTLSDLTNLRSFDIFESNITTIHTGEFENMNFDGTFFLPDVGSVEAGAFANCKNITAVAISSSYMTIDDNAFSGCTALTTVYGRAKSSAETFARNNGLEFKDINDISSVASGSLYAEYNGEQTVGTNWYYNKETKTLSFVSMKSGWNETGSLQFAVDGKGWQAYINEIETIIVGDGLGKVSGSAFTGLTALKTVELPAALGQIDQRAFDGCTSLRTIYVRGNAPIEGVADLHNISNIGTQGSAYKNCAFDTVILKDSVTSVSGTAFSGTPVTTVIGKSDFAQTYAAEIGAEYRVGYVNDNTVWYIDGDTLYVTTKGKVTKISEFENYADTIKKIVFTADSDIDIIVHNAFSALTLDNVLFKCNAPANVGDTIFGSQSSSFIVYYADGVSGFTKPIWKGYPSALEGTEANVRDSGLCKEGGYTWSLSYDNILTISGSGNGKLEFTNVPDWNAMGNLPWNKYADEITMVIIGEETAITSLAQYSFAFHKNLKTVIIPSTLTDLSAYNVFAADPKLDTIAVQGNDVIDGVIDLRNITKLNHQIFEASFGNTTPTFYLGKKLESLTISKLGKDSASITFCVYPGTVAESAIMELVEKQHGDTPNANVTKNVSMRYYTSAEDPTFITSGTQNMQNGYVEWSVDLDTMTLTFKMPDGVTGWNELLYNGNSAELTAFKKTWKNAIKHIVVGNFSKYQYNGKESLFSGWSNLESICFTQATLEFQTSTESGLFENCPKLTTIGWSGKVTEGVADLTGWNKWSGTKPKNIFKGCTSLTNVIITPKTGTNINEVFNGMFIDCTSLEEVTIPAITISVGSNAFDGCTSLKKVVFESGETTVEATSFPSKSDLYIIAASAEQRDVVKTVLGETETKVVFYEEISGAITMQGYKVRISEYNGLRSIFSLDRAKVSELESSGYTLKEFGVIFAAEKNKTSAKLTNEGGEYVTGNASVIKRAVFRDGVQTDKVLEINDSEILFAGTVVNFTPEYYQSNVYFCSYEVYVGEDGSEQIVYTECGNDDYKTVSLYDVCLNSYKTGLINAENDTEGIVWGILNSCAATLKAESEYNAVDGLTDLNGNAIGSEFTFSDVPACRQTADSEGNLTFAETGVTISLFLDRITGKYTAVYHGIGELPATSRWGIGTAGQLRDSFARVFDGGSKAVKAVGLSRPNPTLKSSVVIDTVVIDYGVTKANNEALADLGNVTTVVYSTSLNELAGGVFQACTNLATVVCARGENTVYSIGLADVSYISKVSTDYLFNTCKGIVKIHLPSNIGTSVGSQFSQNNSSLKGIWCGDGTYTEGVADFTGASDPITAIKSKALIGISGIAEIRINNTEENVTVAADGITSGVTITYVG